MFLTPSAYKVICVGSTSKDIFFPTDEGIIIQTPDDIVSKEKIAFELGGKYRVADRYEAVGCVAANVAHGLHRLGHAAACYSKIGQDEMGRWILDAFKQEKVPTDLLSADPVAKTDLSAIIVLTQSSDLTIFHNRDANEKLEIIDEKFAHTEWVFLSALNGEWKTNMQKLLALKETYGFLLAFNPGQHNIKEDASFMLQMLVHADVLLLNKDEAIELTMQTHKELDAEHLNDEMFLLEALSRAGAKTIGMTDGKRGAWSFDGTEYWYCPIHTLKGVVDTTGAGDAFGSGFFAALLNGKPIESALRYGMANSGSVVGAYGAIDGLLSSGDIDGIAENIIPERLN